MNKDFKVDILEKDGILYCTVEIPSYGRLYKKKIYINTRMIEDYLREQHHKIASPLQGQVICNYKKGITNKGTWSFALQKAPPSPPRTPKKRTRKPRTSSAPGTSTEK